MKVRLRLALAIGALLPLLVAPAPAHSAAFDCGTAGVNCGGWTLDHTGGTCTDSGSGTSQVRTCTASTWFATVSAANWVEPGGYLAELKDDWVGWCTPYPDSESDSWDATVALTPHAPATMQISCPAFTKTDGQCFNLTVYVRLSWYGGTVFGRPSSAGLTEGTSIGGGCV